MKNKAEVKIKIGVKVKIKAYMHEAMNVIKFGGAFKRSNSTLEPGFDWRAL